MHGSQKHCGELAGPTVNDIWQIADAGDQKLWRLTHSSRRGTMELGAEDNDGLSQQARTCTRWRITSQCRSSCISRDRPRSYFPVPVTRRAAAFWTCCNDVAFICHTGNLWSIGWRLRCRLVCTVYCGGWSCWLLLCVLVMLDLSLIRHMNRTVARAAVLSYYGAI